MFDKQQRLDSKQKQWYFIDWELSERHSPARDIAEWIVYLCDGDADDNGSNMISYNQTTKWLTVYLESWNKHNNNQKNQQILTRESDATIASMTLEEL